MTINKNTFTYYLILLVFAVSAIFHKDIYGAQVSINPGDYQGQWQLRGISGYMIGSETYHLAPGRYTLFIGTHGYLFLNVDMSGRISSTRSDMVEIVGSTIRFKTRRVMVDPGGHGGFWNVSRVTDLVSGPMEVDLVPGTNYLLFVAGGTRGRIYFYLSPEGNIETAQSESLIVGSDSMRLNTDSVEIHANQDIGLWQIAGLAGQPLLQADASARIHLVKGLSYTLISSLGLTEFKYLGGCAGQEIFDEGELIWDIACAPLRKQSFSNNSMEYKKAFCRSGSFKNRGHEVACGVK